MLARLLARPHVQQPSRGFPKLETKKRETLSHRSQTTPLLVHHQSKSRELVLEALPRLPGLWFRARQQHHIVRVKDEHDRMTHRAVTATPLTIHLTNHHLGKHRRSDSPTAKYNIQ